MIPCTESVLVCIYIHVANFMHVLKLWRNISAKIRVYTVFVYVSRGTLFVNWYRKYIKLFRGTLYTFTIGNKHLGVLLSV